MQQNRRRCHLKALIEDGKLGFAYDRFCRKQVRPVEAYLLQAVERVNASRRDCGRVKQRRLGGSRFGFHKTE
jgi:hypothetical protein